MWQMGGFGPMPGQVHHFLQVENEQDRRYGLERYSKETRRLYGVLDKRLAGGIMSPATLSIADFAILGWAWRHERHQVDLAEFPNVKRWYETMMARPGDEARLRGGAELPGAIRGRLTLGRPRDCVSRVYDLATAGGANEFAAGDRQIPCHGRRRPATHVFSRCQQRVVGGGLRWR